MILHTVNKSPFRSDTLSSCLRLALPGSAILLLEDGVYGAMDNPQNRKLLAHLSHSHELFVLEEDLTARGITGNIMPGIKKTDYAGFVELSLRFSKVLNWF
ncbi:MAG: sulfurtransferase complex subunit TusB [Pseudomonadales bacterium]|nr:sulfurtransferase complex subunit TusB [Pseudomonadales bacterium]